MVVALIALAIRRMHRHVDGHAVTVGQRAGERPDQLLPSVGAEFVGQRHDPLARRTRIFALFGRFGRVPERFAICRRLAVGHHHLGRHHPAALGVVVHHPLPLVDQQRAGAIRRCSNGRTAAAAADGLGAGVVDRDSGASRP